MALWKEEELEEWWDNVYHTNQLEAGVGPGRAREESQLVWGRQPSERLTEPSWSSSSLRSSLSPRDPEQHIQDDHLQLQWPSQLSSSSSPSTSISSSSLLHWASKPKVIRSRLVAFPDFSGFQINLRVDNLYYIKLGHISISLMLGNDIFASI